MDKYAKRKYILIAIFIFVGLIFVTRLFSLQVLDNSYKQLATRNVLREVVNYPARGLIYDRNGELLVYNKAAYDLLVTPREISAFDTLELCNILQIDKAELIESLDKAKAYSLYKSSVIEKQISPEMYAVLQEKLFKYPGFYVQTRTLREYPQKIAAHMLGYVGEVDQKTIDENSYYSQGDYIGVTGLEKVYEDELRGKKGMNLYLVDVHNQVKGSYLNGANDTEAVLGNNLTSTIDSELQAYAEKLMQNKRGAVIAIEPKTGEILCYYSAPSYDPNLLVGRERSSNYQTLLADTLKPLTNRAIAAAYSPGSTFKTLNALIALQEGVITEETEFVCNGPASSPIRCTHDHESPISLVGAVRESCNSYFWNTFRLIINKYPTAEEGYRSWRSQILKFGVGTTLGTEFYGESSGNIPETTYYDRYYGSGHWNALTVRSLSIGQGEVILTPLQMANIAAILANRGYYVDPHLVKAITNAANETQTLNFEKKYSSINSEYFIPVVEGMKQVVENTNTRYTAYTPDLEICGKTGTIENSFGSDHSSFIGFAPKDDPQIAIAVYVENGVWGARYAAPIASLLMEKYVNGSITSPSRKIVEQNMFNANLLNPNQEE